MFIHRSTTFEPPRLSHPKYRADIDGLRAIAVLSVVAFHAFPGSLRGGFIGVDVFFVISGFLISTIVFENLDSGTFSFATFYSRRIRRIFPALFLVLLASLAFGWFALLADEYAQLGKHVAAGTGFVSNLVLWGEAGYFDNSADTKPLLHLWSLGIEEQFYILWPLLLWLASRASRLLLGTYRTTRSQLSIHRKRVFGNCSREACWRGSPFTGSMRSPASRGRWMPG
jgi:peptidoglycan/LPS O-acetylase OafA/YrhL